MENILKKQEITQCNELINSHYQMTLNEKRLILLGISKIESRNFPQFGAPHSFTISANEWCEIFNVKSKKHIYEDIQTATKKIMTRSVTFKISKNRKEEKIINWLDSCIYHKTKSSFTIVFSYSMSIYLTSCVGDFTPYKINLVSNLSSFESLRMYEIMIRIVQDKTLFIKKIKFDVDQLKEILGYKNKYTVFSDFKLKILIPMIDDINTNTNIEICWLPIYTGKKITGIEFSGKYGNQLKLL